MTALQSQARHLTERDRVLRQRQARVSIEIDCFTSTGTRAVSVRGLEVAE